ncbi:hypothetical protein [Maritalea sp.]|uniref:hypothetical protein n=1 Tax=Maritalea sp. TaxID=2003361 RepID=UPI003EF2E570
MQIPINGRQNHEFNITLSEENKDSGKVALLLPGLGYRIENPIFYFTEKLLFDLGYQSARVNYAYDKLDGFRDLDISEIMSILADDAASIGHAVASIANHDELMFVGKSLGTIIMANLLQQTDIMPEHLAWLTPSLATPIVDQSINQQAKNSFVAIGTKDKYYDAKLLKNYADNGATLCIMDGLGHVLEAEEDVPKSIKGHHQLINGMHKWLRA